MVFHYYESPEDAYRAYQEGDLLGISYVDSQLLPTVLSDPTLNVYSNRLPNLSIVLLNLGNAEKPFFQESQVRQALLYGINRQGIVDNLLGGQGMVADGPILPGTWAYNESLPQFP